jgi:hypothetical protein
MWKPPRERPSGSSRGVVRWVLIVTLGEAVGFSVPAITGVAVTSASWDDGDVCRHGAGGIGGRSTARHRPS